MNNLNAGNLELQIFKNPDFGQMRTIVIDGEPWFVGKDVSLVLGYNNTNKALADHVDVDDKRQGDRVTIRDSIGREQHPTIINESGLYSLILSSKLPAAKEFKRWVTSEVLPDIRKHGMYAKDNLLNDPDLLIAMAQEIKSERAKNKALTETNAKQVQLIEEMKPKVSYYNTILNSRRAISAIKIAKDYGMSGMAFNQLLHDQGIQYESGDMWVLYQKYANKGYTHSYTKIINEYKCVMYTRWTQRSRLFLYDYLKEHCGLVPAIEREVA